MPLYQLFNDVGNLAGPNTGFLAGGAGVQVAGSTFNPGISAPRIEESVIEVLDVTAPTNIGTTGTVLATPVVAGKVLVMDTLTGSMGARWNINKIFRQAVPRGQMGVVTTPGAIQTAANGASDAGYAVTTVAGNEAQFGTKALVMFNGPCQAFVETVAGGSAISAGMYLAADGAGNLTYAGASPNAGTVIGTAAGSMTSNVSTPALLNVYLGSF